MVEEIKTYRWGIIRLIDKYEIYINNLRTQIEKEKDAERASLTCTMVAYQVVVDDLLILLDKPKRYWVE